MTTVRVIAGLGNPGARYDGTRHNIGFSAVERLASLHGGHWKAESRFSAHAASIEIAGYPVLLLKPQTYMNASGKAIGQVCRYYKWHPADILVVVDEFQLSLGQTKLTLKGSAGGHNGLNDIIQRFGPGFPRYRIGIAPSEPTHQKMSDYVLGRLTGDERAALEPEWQRIVSEMEMVVVKGPQLAMNFINQRIPKNEPSNNT